ncbi:preprotein translocase subunit SecG [Buchnera aphidicola]|uniref:preprotein translocase subunit SecG n=1 Tax=Buchnera aphidicola TaxID=9 RepID=UPI002238FEEF|nr:preprotein translocase subunit SecG [Buchnera aphidicola]MCW5197580.1 preprotein translocase subunit SecG [Buchnera aphidicola (Chaitophorus viminalis)]
MRVFFLCLYLFISITLIILILLQKNLNSINIGTSNINKNLFNISTSNEFLTRLTIIFACLFLILSILQCNINNCIL